MDQFVDENYKIFSGLYTALSRTKTSVKVAYDKIVEAQRQYFANHTNLYKQKEKKLVCELLDDAMHKFYLGSYTLEQLWGITNYLEFPNHELPKNCNSSLTNQQSEITFMLSSLLDQALYTWRSILDYYLKYLLYYQTGDYIVTMSLNKFFNKLNKFIRENPDNNKTIEINNYLRSKVFNPNCNNGNGCWGDFLKSLRDKTTHQKLLKPKLIKQPNNQGYEIVWPTIQGQNYSQLAQMKFENSAYQMLLDLFPILYGFNWIAGTYKKGMFG